MKNSLYFWIEQYLFGPRNIVHHIVSFILLPISFIWAISVYLKYKFTKAKDIGVACISVGNLTIGGSGKTPVTIALAKLLPRPAIILRGYGRQSSGMKIVSRWGKVESNAYEAGDEAMLYAKELPHALIIVAEKRQEALETAFELGCECILLDDAFSRFEIKKFNILLKPIANYVNFCLPSGPFRAPAFMYGVADSIWQEGIDFYREVRIENQTAKMGLVTAIANPSRLDKYLPSGVCVKYILPDHAYFDKNELVNFIYANNLDSLLVTEKDAVKLVDFDLPLSIMRLEIKLNQASLQKLDEYLASFQIGLDKIRLEKL